MTEATQRTVSHGAPAAGGPSNGVTMIWCVLMPLVGLILGIILISRGRTSDGAVAIVGSLVAVVLYSSLLSSLGA